MKGKDLIGLTVVESIEKIKKHEKSAFFMVYVAVRTHQTKTTFKANKKYHEYNADGKRIYKVVEYDKITFANNKDLQSDSFIIDCEIRQSQHDNWSLSGFVSSGYHNEYYLFVDGLAKGNKGNTIFENKITRQVEYKDGELTKAQRRITL